MNEGRPADWDEPVALPPVDLAFRTIVVPFDGSHAAERALAWAGELAPRSGAEVVVVVAHDPPITLRRRGGITLEGERREMEDEARALAEESVRLLIGRGATARGVVVRGDVVDAILETAQAEGADLIILGRRGLGHEVRTSGRRELGHGAVADRIARHAEIPVVLVG